MNNMIRGLLSIFLCAVMSCHAAPLNRGQVRLVQQGETDVTSTFGKINVSVKIVTHEVDIGKPSDGRPKKNLSSCTYSHFPCVVVDNIEISVNGIDLYVARSIYADLADLENANLRQKKGGQFVLALRGGDASESYTVEITFDKKSVKKREVMSNLNAQIMQRTDYFPSQSMDE